uniref:hypothetical protein n=1 Tax=Actinacidiphila rubida TaxID=310780 RepID=UPI000AA0ED31
APPPAVAGAVGLGGLAVGAVTGDGTPRQSVVTTAGSSGAPPAAGSGTAGTPASRPHSPDREDTTPSARQNSGAGHAPARSPASAGPGTRDGIAPTARATAGGGAGDGSQPSTSSSGTSDGVSSEGSVDASSNASWTQSDVRLTADRPLTSLSVELRIAVTPGVSSTGSFDTVPGQTTASVAVEGGYLVYRWQLNPGQTLAAGTYTFAGQFNHAQGDRDTGGDRYTAAAGGPGGSASLSGGY